ncbi:MAG TPA: cupin domain-containing protein [Polyangiaceae bacterium]|jgi:hypothetical protein|nr:cupin domain-containing protein [Polyangiaceae bacterium]
MASEFVAPRKFVDELLERHWEQEPGIFRQPFPAPLLSPEETFRCMVAGRRRVLRDSGGPPAFRFYIGNRLLQSDVVPFEPRPVDDTLDGYIERIKSMVGDDHFGLTANEFHCGDPAIARKLRGLLRPIYEKRGVGPHFAESFCFMGNYPVSPFGVHIDSASNLTYIVRGKKRYRLFKRAVLDTATEVHSTTKYGPYLDRGTTFEAEEGDLVYWPSGTWHVAEHTGSDVAVSVGLVVYMVRQPYELLATATGRALRNRGPSPTPLLFEATTTKGGEVPSLPGPIADLVEPKAGVTSDVALETRRLWLERLSCLSLDEALPQASSPALQPGDSVAMDPDYPFLWSRSGERVVAAARGDSVVLPNREAVVRTLEKLSSGEPCRVDALQALTTDTDPSVTWVLERLATIHAIVVR